jgi:hypothetical protein
MADVLNGPYDAPAAKTDLTIRYAGRVAGATLVYYTVAKRQSPLSAAVLVALGWLAGGYLIDKYQG